MSVYPLRPLGEIVENLDAQRRPVKSSERRPGPYPYFGAQGIVDHVDGFLFDGEFVLVAEDGENLRSRNQPIALMARGRFWVNNHAHILRGTWCADTRFLFYALNQADIAGYVTGSTIPKLSQGNLNRILVPCPSIDEQREIVAILGALDDKIDLNRRMNETLEAMTRAIFQDWFVTFGPTRAKQEGHPPYLAPDLWSLFPNRLDDQGKPEGWRDRPLAEFMGLISGGTPRTSEPAYWGGDIPWFSVVDAPAPSEMYVITTEKTITAAGLENCAATLLPEGAVIITARGTVGKLAVVGCPMAMNRSCYAAVGTGGIPSSFILFLLKEAVQRLQANTHGSVFDTITRPTFQAVSSPMPSLKLAIHFGAVVEPLLARVLSNVRESRTLAATRDLLLPMLMSGELRVRDADRAVAEVA